MLPDEGVDVLVAQLRDRAFDRLHRPIPPGDPQQRVDLGLAEPQANLPCRHTRYDPVWTPVMRHERVGADHGTVADAHAGANARASADPDVVADLDVPTAAWMPVAIGARQVEIGAE